MSSLPYSITVTFFTKNYAICHTLPVNPIPQPSKLLKTGGNGVDREGRATVRRGEMLWPQGSLTLRTGTIDFRPSSVPYERLLARVVLQAGVRPARSSR